LIKARISSKTLIFDNIGKAVGMRRLGVRRQAPSASSFLKNYLNWNLIGDAKVTEITKKLREAIDSQMDVENFSRYSYRFFKYARFSRKNNEMVYGLALVGWRHYKKYRLYPNIWSYLEVDSMAKLDKSIDLISENFDKLLSLNSNFLKTGFGIFAIPRSLYQEVIQSDQNNQNNQ
jgi:hypothetical protein